ADAVALHDELSVSLRGREPPGDGYAPGALWTAGWVLGSHDGLRGRNRGRGSRRRGPRETLHARPEPARTRSALLARARRVEADGAIDPEHRGGARGRGEEADAQRDPDPSAGEAEPGAGETGVGRSDRGSARPAREAAGWRDLAGGP